MVAILCRSPIATLDAEDFLPIEIVSEEKLSYQSPPSLYSDSQKIIFTIWKVKGDLSCHRRIRCSEKGVNLGVLAPWLSSNVTDSTQFHEQNTFQRETSTPAAPWTRKFLPRVNERPTLRRNSRAGLQGEAFQNFSDLETPAR